MIIRIESLNEKNDKHLELFIYAFSTSLTLLETTVGQKIASL